MIAQATGRDVYNGGRLARFYGRLTVVGGLAAVVGPLVGGALTVVMDCRGLFLVLAGIGAVILLWVAVGYGETLPAHARTSGGFTRVGGDMRLLLADRAFVGAVLARFRQRGLVRLSQRRETYVLQGIYGPNPFQYALAFGLNSAGYALFGYLAGTTSQRWERARTLIVGVLVAGAGAVRLTWGWRRCHGACACAGAVARTVGSVLDRHRFELPSQDILVSSRGRCVRTLLQLASTGRVGSRPKYAASASDSGLLVEPDR